MTLNLFTGIRLALNFIAFLMGFLKESVGK